MSWVRLDDRMPDNPKVSDLSDAAFRAYVTSICYSARELTDGLVSARKAREFSAGRAKVMKELTDGGLWEVRTDGYAVHDYLTYNPTRAATLQAKEELRQKRSEAGKKGMANRWQTDNTPDNKTHNKTHNPVAPIPEGDLNNPLPLPDPQHQNQSPEPLRAAAVVLPSRKISLGFERSFGRLLSPMELESIKHLEDEHPEERIEYALRQAAEHNKRSLSYVKGICERMERDGDTDGANSRQPAAAVGAGSVAVGVSDMDRRRAAFAARRRGSES